MSKVLGNYSTHASNSNQSISTIALVKMYFSRRSSTLKGSSFQRNSKLINTLNVVCSLLVIFLCPHIATCDSLNSRNSCERQCENANSDGKIYPDYEAGKSYFYVFETESKTQLLNTKSDETSVLNLKGYAVLTAITKCYFDLSIVSLSRSQISLQTSSSQKTSLSGYITRPLIYNSLRFRLENGNIQQVCTTGNDTFMSENIKKAIISLLPVQNFPDGQKTGVFEQSDISGKCQVSIEKQGNTYYKNRDLNKCTHREFGSSFLNGVPFDSPATGFHAVPLLDSTSSCKQDIYNKIVQTSVCHEKHVLKSLEPGSPTIRTSLNTSLTFVSLKRNFQLTGQSKDYAPTTPYFRYGPEDVTDESITTPSELSSLRTALVNICEEFVTQDLSPKLNLSSSLSQVNNMKLLLQKIDTENLKNIFNEITTGQICSTKKDKLARLFLKTVVKSLSSATIELLTNLLERNELSQELRQEVFDAIKFARNPTRKSLPILEKLVKSLETALEVDIEKNQADFLLTSSAFAYQYCKLVNGNCGSVNEYKSLVNAIATFTINSFNEVNQPSGDEPGTALHSVIVGLQALGNLKHLTPLAVEAIGKCLSKSNRVKIHALSAFRRDPCTSLKNKAMSLLNSLMSGSDVRIHSYLAIMRCIEEDDLEVLQRLIDNEQSNQVSSFIYSHINNQLESSSPGKASLKALLRKIHFNKDLPKVMESVGKFSKNIEWSGLYKENSIGFASESDIVYSQNSYIPRTANLNLTFDLLGRSYNFLEAGVYLENFEFILNRLNAPRSNPSEEHVETVPADYEDGIEDFLDRADVETNEIPKVSVPTTEEPLESEPLERKGGINPDDLAHFRNQVTIKDRYSNVGSGDTFIRVHGTTVAVKSFSLSLEKDIFALLQANWLRSYFNSLPTKLKNLIIDRTKPATFLNEQLVVPTVAGIPLSLKIRGESLIASKYETNIDFEALFSRDESIQKDMSLKLFPNVASTLSASMTLGPENFEAGFQLEGNLHLSAAVDVKLEKRPGHLRTEYNFQDVRSFDVFSRLHWIASSAKSGPKKSEIRSQTQAPTAVYYDSCAAGNARQSWISSEILGIKYCYYIKLPRGLSLRNFWLQGPIAFGVTSEKHDPAMKGFVLDIETEETEETSFIKVTWDAPGSTKNRRIVLTGSYSDSPTHVAQIDVEFPSKHSPLALTATLHDTEVQKGVTATLRRGSEENANVFNLLVKMSRPNENEIIYEPIISRTIENTDIQLNFLNGTLSRHVGKSLNVDMSLKLGQIVNSCEITGLVVAERSSNGDFEYQLSNGRISLVLPQRDSYELQIDGKIFKKQPSFGFQVNSLYGRQETNIDLAITSEIKLIPYQTLAISTKSSSVQIPAHNIDFKFLGDLELSENNQSKFTLESSLENYWDIQAIRRAGNTFGSLELNVDIASWGRKISLLTQRNHVDLEELTQFDFESYLKWDAGRDESRQMALKIAFLRNDTNTAFNIFESKNELTFTSQKHQAEIQVKVPTDRTNGEYLVNIGYVSPKRANYDISYRNVLRTGDNNNASSEMQLTVNLPKLRPIIASWEKSLYVTSTPNHRFRFRNNLIVNLGEEKLVGIAISAAYVNSGQLSKYFHSEASVNGRLIPLHFGVKSDIRLLEDKSLEVSLELAKNISGKGESEEKKGTFSFTFQPQTRRDERDYSVELSWSPEDSQESFITKPFSFSNHLIIRFTSFRDFKILNDGNMKLRSGQTSWSKNIELSRSQLICSVIFRPPEGGGILNVNAGVGPVTTSGKQVFLKISSQINNVPDFNFSFKTNIHNPRQLINLSISVDQKFQLILEHNLAQNNETNESVYKSLIAASIQPASSELRLTNEITLLPFEVRVESGCYLTISSYVSIDSIFEGKLSKSAENENKWYTVMALKKRRGKNEIPDGDQPLITFSGPIYLTERSVRSTLLLEWPALHHSHILLRVQAEFSQESSQEEQSLGTTLILNISGYDKKVSLQDFEKDSTISDLGSPTFNTQTEAVAFSNVNVRTLFSSLEDGGRRLSINIQSSSGSPSNYKLPTEINMEAETVGGIKRIHLDVKLKDGDEDHDRQYSCVVTSADEVDGDFNQKTWKLVTVRNAKVDSTLVNITSGFRWIASASKNNLVQNEQINTKALCLIAEKVMESGQEFTTCTLGFNSNARRILGEEESVDLKLVLLDRIGFRGLKLEQSNLLVLNSSFWLDSIDKPDEELRFSVVKKRVLRNAEVNPEGAFWGPDHAGQFYFTAKHPFFVKDLQIRTSLGPDPNDWSSNNIKGILELDIFDQENDKIMAQVDISSEKPTTEPSDDFLGFYDMDDDYSASIGESGGEKPRDFKVSLISEGLNLNFRGEGKLDLSSGISYSILDRNLETKEGKIIFRPPSLLDSNVFQFGPTPIISISFGGIPSINLQDPNSKDTLTLEYYASPQPTFRLFSNDFPENTFYSLIFPPESEEEFFMEFSFDNDSTIAKVVNLNVALNTSKLLQIRSDWSLKALKSTWRDLQKLNTAIYEGIKTEVKNISKEVHLNLQHYSSKISGALPNIQPLLDKLDREIQENLEEIRSSSHSNVVYERISSFMLKFYNTAKAYTLKSIGAVKTAQQNFFLRVEQSGILSMDTLSSKITEWANKIVEESVSAGFLAIESLKKSFWDTTSKLTAYLETNPELKKMLANATAYLKSFIPTLQNIFRKILHRTISLRPYLRYLLPKEAHEFLITLKHYYLGKLESNGTNGNDGNASLVTSEQVFSEGYNAAKIIGRRALEGKGFLFQNQNESLLVQFPLLKPVRRLRDVFSKSEFVRPKYTQSFEDFFQWITNPDINDSRNPRWLTLKTRIESALLGGIGPDDAVGIIIGSKFYRTFDGKFHRFDGSCQYLLAADFFTGNITVHVEGNSESSDMRDLIFSDNEDSISILPNATVVYNGRIVEIPLTQSMAEFQTKELGPFSAFRYNVIGEVVEISKKHSGVTLACLVDYPVCSIQFKSYLYGRALGLLGTNNLEHYDDFSTPSGEIVGKTSKFYRSWRLNRECRETRGNAPVTEAPAEIKARCYEIFAAETSPLRSCFSIIHPSDFQETCEALAMEAGAEIKKSVCSAAAAYWIECREHRVPINYVSECETI